MSCWERPPWGPHRWPGKAGLSLSSPELREVCRCDTRPGIRLWSWQLLANWVTCSYGPWCSCKFCFFFFFFFEMF